MNLGPGNAGSETLFKRLFFKTFVNISKGSDAQLIKKIEKIRKFKGKTAENSKNR